MTQPAQGQRHASIARGAQPTNRPRRSPDQAPCLARTLTDKAHARRNFVEIVSAFPAEVRYLIECLKQVYQTDAQAKQQHLSAEERLRLHQQQSRPVMEELHRWLQEQFD